MSVLRPLPAEDAIEQHLAERLEITQRPRETPRQVLGGWLGNAGVGIGAAVVAGIALGWLGAPESVLLSGAGTVGGVVFGGMMIWRGSIDERADARNVRRIKQALAQMERRHATAVERLQTAAAVKERQLQAAFGEIVTLEKALDAMQRERDRAVYDLVRERNAAASGGRSTYVPPIAPAPAEVADATAMLLHRYESGEHLSKRAAAAKRGWSERRWQAALDELVKAGVAVPSNAGADYPAALDEALQTFGAYLLRARALSAPTINRLMGRTLYVESDDGE